MESILLVAAEAQARVESGESFSPEFIARIRTALSEVRAQVGAKGGHSTSAAKVAAGRANLVKARAAKAQRAMHAGEKT